jgi:hypothetical protein
MGNRYAAMVKLGGETEKEVSIIYYSTIWEELRQLLEAPLEFMKSREFLWKTDSRDSVAWQLLAPVTLELVCAPQEATTLLQAVSTVLPAVEWTPPDFGEEERLAKMAPLLESGLEQHAAEQELELARLRLLLSTNFDETPLKKSFLVEFAAFTNTLRVLYFPDVEDANRRRKERKGRGVHESISYKGGIVNPVFIEVESASSIKASVLHFDLDEHSPRMRADFVFSQIEDPYWVADYLNDNLAALAIGSTPLVQENQQLGIARPAIGRPMPEGFQFRPGIPFAANDLYAIFPRLKITNLSMPVETFVCEVGKPCPIHNKHVYFIGDATLELYYRITTDPFAVIEAAVRKMKLGQKPPAGKKSSKPGNS